MKQTTYFALITDLHIVEPEKTLYGLGLGTPEAATRLVAHLKEESVDLQAVICLGDLADTALARERRAAVAGHESYSHARERLGELNLPILTIAGNHDDPVVMQEYFPNRWDSSRHGISVSSSFDTTLVGIDLRTGPEPTGHASAACLRELDSVLTKSRRALLFSHYPLFNLDNHRINNELSVSNRAEIQEIVARHQEKIHATFHGHLHLWVSACNTHTVSYGVPSSAFTFILEPQSGAKEVIGSSPCGYILLGINDDGTLTVRPRFLPPAK